MSIPPNFPLINSSVPINAISSIKDLEGKTLPEIWSIICALSNYNSSLLNTIIQLNGTIRQKDDDINILRGQLSDMAALKTTYARLCEETKVLEMQISELLSNEVSSERRISELENEVASINANFLWLLPVPYKSILQLGIKREVDMLNFLMCHKE